MFVEPTWVEGFIVQLVMFIIIPLIIASGIGIAIGKLGEDWGAGILSMGLVFTVLFFIAIPAGSYYWHNAYEVPSVQEKIITVGEWQPRPGLIENENGMLVISNAADLMLITTEEEGFLNEENFLFQKFNTRDIFNELKVNGTYKIKYYGWREGYNSGFPNILSIEEVIDETNATNNNYKDYFGVKLSA